MATLTPGTRISRKTGEITPPVSDTSMPPGTHISRGGEITRPDNIVPEKVSSSLSKVPIGLSSKAGASQIPDLTQDISNGLTEINNNTVRQSNKKQQDINNKQNETLPSSVLAEDQNSKSPETLAKEEADSQMQEEINAIVAPYKAQALANTRVTEALTNQLEGQYNQRRREIQDLNKANVGVVTQAGLRSGAARYSPETNQGMVSGEELEGFKRLDELNGSYINALTSAQTALEDKNYVLAKEQANVVSDIKSQYRDAQAKLSESVQKKNEEIQKKKRAADISNSVSYYMHEKGIEDPSEMINYLNFDDAGDKIADYSSKEIRDAMTDLGKSKDITDLQMTVAKYGAPLEIQKAVGRSRTTQEALAAAAGYLEDPLDRKLKELNVKEKTKQLKDSEDAGIVTGTPAELNQAKSWAKNIQDGTAHLSDIKSDKMKSLVAQELAGATSNSDVAVAEKASEKIANIDRIITHPGMNGVVGTKFYARIAPGDRFSGKQQEFQAMIKQLQAQETLDLLVAIKGQGATLGALSDKEREMLERGATKFGSWEIRDKQNNGTGKYDISEKLFKEELTTLKNLAEKARKAALGNAPSGPGDVNTYLDDVDTSLQAEDPYVTSGYDLN